MNILQHKSWHVYNQKNRDKVKKDEANAEAEQKRVEERAIAADREHRLAVLRQRAQRRLGNSGDDSNDPQGDRSHGTPTAEDTMAVATTSKSQSKQEHVNFWADLEKQDTKSSAGNPEREEEAKAKQEKWDRTIAMHLDTGIKGKSPWYLSPHAGSMETNAKKGDDKEFTKVREDPLQAMKSMLDKHEKHRRKRSKSPSRTRRHHRESTREQKLRQEPEGMSTMYRLRKERLEREKAERTRTNDLLHSPQNYPTERQMGYNQQFNPTATTMAHSYKHPGRFPDTNRYDRGRGDHYSSRGSSTTSRDYRQRPY